MKISKRVREEAAMICAIAASNEWTGDWNNRLGDPPKPGKTAAGNLAWAAQRITYRVWRESPHWNPSAPWAEAESLLRTGWSPE